MDIVRYRSFCVLYRKLQAIFSLAKANEVLLRSLYRRFNNGLSNTALAVLSAADSWLLVALIHGDEIERHVHVRNILDTELYVKNRGDSVNAMGIQKLMSFN